MKACRAGVLDENIPSSRICLTSMTLLSVQVTTYSFHLLVGVVFGSYIDLMI